MAVKGALPVLDPIVFYRRVTRLTSLTEDNSDDSGNVNTVKANAVVIVCGDSDPDVIYSRTLSVHNWLFSWEMPGVVMAVIGGDVRKIVVVTAKKKAAMFRVLAEAKRPEGTVDWPLVVIQREKGDENDSKSMASFVDEITHIKDGDKDDESKKKKAFEAVVKVGRLVKEKQIGAFAEAVDKTLGDSEVFETVDVSAGIAKLLAVKEESEIEMSKKAGILAAAAVKRHFVTKMEAALDKGTKVKHAQLADSTDSAIANPQQKLNVKFNSQFVESCFLPIVQSGGVYNLRPSAQSDDNTLHAGTIIVRLAARYRAYCAGVARTYIVDPTSKQKSEYETLLYAFEAAVTMLRPGVELCKVHAAVIEAVGEKDPALVTHLTKSFGFGTGLEFRDASMVINAKNTTVIEPGMVFNVAIGFDKLEKADDEDDDDKKNADGGKKKDDPRAKVYALMVGDTVVVAEDGSGNDIITAQAPRKYKEVTYEIADPDSGAASSKGKAAASSAGKFSQSKSSTGDAADGEELKGSAILAEKLRSEPTAEDIRKQHQEELAARRREEAQRRYGIGGSGSGGSSAAAAKAAKERRKEVRAYRTVSDYPFKVRMDSMFVDQRKESVLFPVNGYLVPFHISTIKRVTKQDETGATHLRFQFAAPDTGIRAAGALTVGDPARNVYVKELSYRCRDAQHMVGLMKQVMDLRKRFNAAQSEKKEKEAIVAQEDLQLLRGKNPVLRNVYIRPSPGRRCCGTLEAHANGLRFTAQKAGTPPVDIIFRNIKHAFFQPAENESLVLIHFHLHNAVMIGKKGHRDVQVYTEVGEQSYALDKSKKNRGYDYDEIEEEQREREVRQKLNENFQAFVKRLEGAIARNGIDLEFDIPYRELGFFGVPHKAMSFIMPSVHCLVELSELPFFIVTLDEIEVVNLERVQLGLSNFDMVFVNKDFSIPPVHVNTIPMESLEPVKQWLDSSDIKYYEGRANLHWNKIMATIREDPSGFFEDGGWDFLDMEKRDSDDESESESEESEFAPSESDPESESDYFSADGYSDYDDDAYSAEEELSEEGQSWEQLERKAEREDKEKARRGEFDDRGRDNKRARRH